MVSAGDKIRQLTKAVTGGKDRFETSALLRLMGSFKQRIFNKGQDSDGGAIGAYRSPQHIKKRISRGRQTGYKDLELEGALRRSIRTGKSGNSNVMGFDNDKSRLISEGQHTQTGKDIFIPSASEIKEAQEAYFDELNEVISSVYR